VGHLRLGTEPFARPLPAQRKTKSEESLTYNSHLCWRCILPQDRSVRATIDKDALSTARSLRSAANILSAAKVGSKPEQNIGLRVAAKGWTNWATVQHSRTSEGPGADPLNDTAYLYFEYCNAF
jgi:hypothetical protein